MLKSDWQYFNKTYSLNSWWAEECGYTILVNLPPHHVYRLLYSSRRYANITCCISIYCYSVYLFVSLVLHFDMWPQLHQVTVDIFRWYSTSILISSNPDKKSRNLAHYIQYPKDTVDGQDIQQLLCHGREPIPSFRPVSMNRLKQHGTYVAYNHCSHCSWYSTLVSPSTINNHNNFLHQPLYLGINFYKSSRSQAIEIDVMEIVNDEHCMYYANHCDHCIYRQPGYTMMSVDIHNIFMYILINLNIYIKLIG